MSDDFHKTAVLEKELIQLHRSSIGRENAV